MTMKGWTQAIRKKTCHAERNRDRSDAKGATESKHAYNRNETRVVL